MIGCGYEVAATLYARRVQTRHGGLAEAKENRYRLRGEPGRRGTAVDGEEAVGLVAVGCHLGKRFGAAETDRYRNADLVAYFILQADKRLGWCAAVKRLGAAEIEKGFVDREWLHKRRERQHAFADLAADGDVMVHARADHHGVGASFQRLPGRHRRPDAELPRDVAGRRHDAAFAPADDDRSVTDFGIVALLDRRIEGVAVDMGDGEIEKLARAADIRRAAMRTAVRRFGAADIAASKTRPTEHLECIAAGHHDSLLSRRTVSSARLPFVISVTATTICDSCLYTCLRSSQFMIKSKTASRMRLVSPC